MVMKFPLRHSGRFLNTRENTILIRHCRQLQTLNEELCYSCLLSFTPFDPRLFLVPVHRGRKYFNKFGVLVRHWSCSPGPTGNFRQRTVHVWRAGTEHVCEGCQKTHFSPVWYYRHQLDKANREWLCGVKYLLLRNGDLNTWRIVVVGV